MRILSIDPGVARTGYAVLERKDGNTTLHKFGCIETSAGQIAGKRLLTIYNEIKSLIENEKITRVIVEKLFFNTNQKTVINVAQAQGVISVVAADHDIEVEYLTPLQIKQSLTGYGRAEKDQVRKMVMILLDLKTKPEPDDASDAIACGLSYLSINSE